MKNWIDCKSSEVEGLAPISARDAFCGRGTVRPKQLRVFDRRDNCDDVVLSESMGHAYQLLPVFRDGGSYILGRTSIDFTERALQRSEEAECFGSFELRHTSPRKYQVFRSSSKRDAARFQTLFAKCGATPTARWLGTMENANAFAHTIVGLIRPCSNFFAAELLVADTLEECSGTA